MTAFEQLTLGETQSCLTQAKQRLGNTIAQSLAFMRMCNPNVDGTKLINELYEPIEEEIAKEILKRRGELTGACEG